MNRKQLQLEICKALLDGRQRIGGGKINDTEYAFTSDGISCTVFSEKEIIFDTSKVNPLDISQLLEDKANDKEITETGTIFKQSIHTLVELAADNLFIYADPKLCSRFKGYKMFAFEPLGRILVKDDYGQLIGAFLPIRRKDKSK